MCYTGEYMKRLVVLGGIALLLAGLLGATLYGQRTRAGGIKYTFTARAVITSVDEANKSFKADVTKATPNKAMEAIEGSNREFKTGTAKVYKRDGTKDVRGTYHNFAVGQEVGIKGIAKEDDTFELTFARIHDRAFTVVGLMQNHDKTLKTVKILITTSSYKASTYNGKEVTMSYTDDSKFRNASTALSFSDVNANTQKVKVIGTITDANSWKVTQLHDSYTGK